MDAHPEWMNKLDTLDSFGWATHERQDGSRICEWCKQTSGLWYHGNNLNAGPDVPCLAALTDFEEMLISPAHAAVQVWTLSERGEERAGRDGRTGGKGQVKFPCPLPRLRAQACCCAALPGEGTKRRHENARAVSHGGRGTRLDSCCMPGIRGL